MYVALAVLLFWSAWGADTDSYPGVPGDAELQMWWLRWVPFALSHGHNPLFTDYIGYPFGVNAMWCNVAALPDLLLIPVTEAFGVVTAYKVMATLAVALSAWCCFLALRRYVRRESAAGLGALLYGFSPYMMAHSLGHMILTLAFIPPLIVLVVDEILIRRRRALLMGCLLGLLAVAQLLTAEELVATEATAGIVAVAALALFKSREVGRSIKPALWACAGAGAVFLILGLPPLAFQFLGPRIVRGVIHYPDFYVTDLLNFFLPTSIQLIHPALADNVVRHFTGNLTEWDGYVGVGLVTIFVVVLLRSRSHPAALVATSAALVMAVLSLGPHLHIEGTITSYRLLWRVEGLPLLPNVLPGRLMLYFYLFGSLVLAIFADALFAAERRALTGLGAALVVVALVPLIPRWPYPSTRADIPDFFTTPMVNTVPEGSVVLVAPFARTNTDAMLWQASADMRFRMPEGDFYADPSGAPGPVPTPLSTIVESIQMGGAPPIVDQALRSRLVTDMESSGVDAVIVGPMYYRAAEEKFFSQLYDRPPTREGDCSIWMGLPPTQ